MLRPYGKLETTVGYTPPAASLHSRRHRFAIHLAIKEDIHGAD
jgi:hypothetical protein